MEKSSGGISSLWATNRILKISVVFAIALSIFTFFLFPVGGNASYDPPHVAYLGTGLILVSGTGDTVASLQDTTTPHTVDSTWDFDNIWQENPGGFPTLR